MINGDAVEKGPLCQQIVVLFFGTVDDIRNDCEIEAWMVSPSLDPTIVRVPGRAALPRSPQREGAVIQREGRCVFCCDTDLLVSGERNHGVMFSPNPCRDRHVRKRTTVICDHSRPPICFVGSAATSAPGRPPRSLLPAVLSK